MPKIAFDVEVNTQGVKTGIAQAEGYIEDAKRRLKSKPGVDLTINLAKLKSDLVAVNDSIKRAIKAGDPERVMQLRIDQVGLGKQITLANKSLNNFINTGNKDISAMSRLFQSVSLGGSKLSGIMSTLGMGSSGIMSGLSQIAGSGGAGAFGGISGAIAGISGPAVLAGGALFGLGAALKSASGIARSFEDAWTGVSKTVDGTPEQLAVLRKQLVEMSTRIPVKFEDLSALAQTAGAMGVPIENLAKFTEVTAKLSSAIDGISGQDAVTALKVIGDQTGESLDNIDKMASAVVLMGNNFAGTEGDILDFSSRLAKFVGEGSGIGLAYSQVIGFSTAMVAMGITSEMGGTALGTTFGNIEKAVGKGGKELENFARIAKVSSDEFASSWKEDAGGAFVGFLKGIEKVENKAQVIEDLFGSNSRILLSINALSSEKGLGLLEQAMQGAQQEMDNTGDSISALDKEFEKRTQTLSSRIQVMKNSWAASLEPTGSMLNDYVLKPFVDFVASMGSMLGAIIGYVVVFSTTLYDLFVRTFTLIFEVTDTTISLIKNVWSDLGKNLVPFVKALVANIGIAFGNLGNLIGVGLDSAKGVLEKFFNGATGMLNDFMSDVGNNQIAQKFGLGFLKDKKFNKVSFGGDFGGQSKAFVDLPSLLGNGSKADFAKLIGGQGAFSGYLDNFSNKMKAVTSPVSNLDSAENKMKVKVAKDLADEIVDLEDKANKKGSSNAIKTNEDKLRKKAQQDIDALDDSELNEEEKALAIKDIQTKLEDDIRKLKSKTLEEEFSNNDKVIKKVEDTVDSIDKEWENSIKSVGKYAEELEKIKGKFDELKEKAKETIRDINNSLSELSSDKQALQEDTMNNLAENRVKLLQQQKDLQKDLANTEDFDQKLKIQQELERIAREIAMIEANVSADVLKRAEDLAKLTDTERTLLTLKEKETELDAKAFALYEKKLIAEAIANGRKIDIGADGKVSVEDETGKMVEITDFKAKEYAIDSANKLAELTSQQDMVTKMLDEELSHLADVDAKKRAIESSFTSFFGTEIDARNAKLSEYIRMANEAYTALQRVGMERQAQQAQAVTTSSLSNTTNKTVNQNFNVNSSVDAESIGRSISKKI